MSSTKTHPGKFRCYDAALPDEPMFVILGRDPAAAATLEFWADERERVGKNKADDDIDRILACRSEAKDMYRWRTANLDPHGDGVATWRLPRPEPDGGRPVRMLPELGMPYGDGQAFENRLHTQRELMVSVGKAVREIAHELNEWRRSKGPVNSTGAVLVDGAVSKLHAEVERLGEAARAIKLSETDPYAEFAKNLGKPVEHDWREYDDTEGERPRKVIPLSFARMHELLDYATAYGQFDENTPSGTESDPPEMSSPMNDMRRAAIWQLKRCMGIILADAEAPVADDGPKPQVSLLIQTEGLFKVPGVEQPQTMDQIATAYRKAAENVRVGIDPEKDENGYYAIKRLEEVVHGLQDGRRPVPYDLYRAVSNAPEDGWTYETAGIGLTDLENLLALFTAKRERKIDADLHKEATRVISETFRPSGLKLPTLDTKPDDLAHAPEVPAHRFAAFYESGSYAYARGLEVAPPHLPKALDAMARSNWHLVAIFGATDSANIGFIFRRGIGEDLPCVDLGRGQEP